MNEGLATSAWNVASPRIVSHVSMKPRLGVKLGRQRDDRFAAATGKADGGKLVAHALGQVERVLYGGFEIRIRLHACATAGGAKPGRVHGNDDPGSSWMVTLDDDTFSIPTGEQRFHHSSLPVQNQLTFSACLDTISQGWRDRVNASCRSA